MEIVYDDEDNSLQRIYFQNSQNRSNDVHCG
ncbi:uncharacterized protein G2W53_034334 [Senna tora]|uniref:Uncharacterized protein n=1 Tax=Senna tora TaxID=362788 RepID=A0A834T176_9FABA|nr:uncharacterized protein G2W53_034334 [Senna tora]